MPLNNVRRSNVRVWSKYVFCFSMKVLTAMMIKGEQGFVQEGLIEEATL